MNLTGKRWIESITSNKGQTINDLGGLGQRIRVEFFFPDQPADEFFFPSGLLGWFFFPGRVAVEFFFLAFARPPPKKSLMVFHKNREPCDWNWSCHHYGSFLIKAAWCQNLHIRGRVIHRYTLIYWKAAFFLELSLFWLFIELFSRTKMILHFYSALLHSMHICIWNNNCFRVNPKAVCQMKEIQASYYLLRSG